MRSSVVVYHKACPDGFGAAWAAWKGMATMAPEYPPEFVAANHGDEPPLDIAAGRDVYCLDYCYKAEPLLRLLKRAASVHVIDHHPTARPDIEAVAGADGAFSWTFDEAKSGAMLTWEFFHRQAPPLLIRYIEDRDLWKFVLPYSKEISAWLSSFPFSFAGFDVRCAFLAEGPQKNGFPDATHPAVMEGAAILRYQSRLTETICELAHPVNLAGHDILAVNTPVLQSEVAGKLAEGRPFGACWFLRGDGTAALSLRRRDEDNDPKRPHLGRLCRSFGGGGHEKAAGFQVPLGAHPIFDLLETPPEIEREENHD